MRTTILLAFILLLSVIQTKANTPEAMNRVPKVKSLEIGYRNLIGTDFENINSSGYTFMFDYAWQLSGFHGNKKESFISVPLGYTILNIGEAKSARILSYGWTVKHNLRKNKRAVPFLGYGLLLNQLSIDGIEGKVMGHQTRFDFGYDFNNQNRLYPFIKIEYSMTRYYQLANSKNKHLNSWVLKTGFRF